MPPKKRARASATPAATTPAASSPPPPNASTPSHTTQPDGWAPEHETALFKALLHFKPTGPHKHFRMLSIRNYITAHSSPSSEHLRIPEIWNKLGGMYDMDKIDSREANLLFASDRVSDESDEEERSDDDGRKAEQAPKLFALPEFGDGEDGTYFRKEMWRRRRKSGSDGGSSEPAGPSEDGDETEDEEEVKRKRGRVKGTVMSRAAKRGRSETRGATTRRARQLRGREAGSVTSRDTEDVRDEEEGKEGEDEKDIKEEDDSDDDEADDDEAGENEEEEENLVPARSTRSAGKRDAEPEKAGRSSRRK